MLMSQAYSGNFCQKKRTCPVWKREPQALSRKISESRCFKNFQCPTDYKSSKCAWMTSAVFKKWFHESFVPQVTSFLKEKGLPIKALLLIDNAPSHQNEAQLATEDGQILAMFMPPNVTPSSNQWIKMP
uniref:Jerky protein homolog-like n=1 Tax=Zeugodacus cucurbitae TaxID=28588 RepID=A0A0A1XD32_ZEUCU